MSHTPTPTSHPSQSQSQSQSQNQSRPGSRLTPSQIRLPSTQIDSEDLIGRVSNMSIGNHPSAHSHHSYQNNNINMNGTAQPPPQGQPQPFASLHAHAPIPPLYALQDYPIGGNNSSNSNPNSVPTNPYWNTTSASAPGSAYTNLFPGGVSVGVGGFGSPEISPIGTNFDYDHHHGQGQGQGQMVDIYGNPTGHSTGQNHRASFGGNGNVPRRRGDSINSNNNGGHGHSNSITTLNALYNGGGYGQEHLESVPSSPMSMSSGMGMGMMSYYGYGGEHTFYGPSGMYPRGNRGGKHVSHHHRHGS